MRTMLAIEAIAARAAGVPFMMLEVCRLACGAD